MRIRISWLLISIAFFAPSNVFACGDLDFACKQREGQLNLPIPTPQMPVPGIPLPTILDPDCRSDPCRAVQNLGQELQMAPDTLAQCIRNVGQCVNEILSAPVALLAQAYLDGLYRQSEGRTRPFSPQWIALTQPYFDVDLRGVTYAENINTRHGQTVAYCDRIFFTHSGNPWIDRNELYLTLHEMEHLGQCQRRGKRTFLAEYLLKGLVDITKNGTLNVHDLHNFEVAADAKADSLTNRLWNEIQQGAPSPLPSPIPTPAPSYVGFPSGYGMQTCGCWGYNPPQIAAESRCQSGKVRTNMCAGFCPGGGSPYAYVCF